MRVKSFKEKVVLTSWREVLMLPTRVLGLFNQ